MAFGWLKNIFVKAGKGIYGFLKSVITSDTVKNLLKSALGAIVQQVVGELQYENLTTGEKREEAVKRIIAQAKSQGLGFSESVIRYLIETVVLRLKDSQRNLVVD